MSVRSLSLSPDSSEASPLLNNALTLQLVLEDAAVQAPVFSIKGSGAEAL